MQKELAKAVSTYEARHKAEVRAKLEAIAKEMGYSLDRGLTWDGAFGAPRKCAGQVGAG